MGKEVNIEDLCNIVFEIEKDIDGITFSGGEPLYQASKLYTFLSKLPKGLDKMLFTGYYDYELNKIQNKCYKMFDLVIEGRFEKEKMGNFLWRGSSNQIISSPTKKYLNQLEFLHSSKSQGLNISIKNNEMYFYGIPTKKDEIKIIKKKMEKYIKIDNT